MQPRFYDREYLNIVYRTDPDALRAVVPQPLEIDEPLVRFEIMKMNDVTGYGPYTEAGQAIPVVFDGERGEYLHAMYLDSFAATASGREVSAYPKVMGSPRLYADNGALVGTSDHGTLRVATATMGYKHYTLDRREAEAQITVPTFMLKTIPGMTGRCGCRSWCAPRSPTWWSRPPTPDPRGSSSSPTSSRRWQTCRCWRSCPPATSSPT